MVLRKLRKTVGSRSSRGASAVEFALLLLPLVLIVFGIVEFGLMFYNQQMLTNASREGARAGIVMGTPRPTPAYIQNTVANYLKDSSGNYILVTFQSGITPNVPPPTPCATTGDALTVRVTYNYYPVVLSGFGLISRPLQLKGQAIMRCE